MKTRFHRAHVHAVSTAGALTRTALAAAAVSTLVHGSAFANPTGAQVVNGQATITTNGNVLTVQNSPGTIIDWQNFSIGSNETTRFMQQNKFSSVLNRITGQDPSQILGTLWSNGKVYLINPNGIVFGQGARVDVNGLVASTLSISRDDFLGGRLRFDAGTNAGTVENRGVISTPDGGQIYLIAPSVTNSGLVSAPNGDVVLAAGRSVQLVDSANPDLHVVISAADDQALNLGQVLARSGKVGIYGALINQKGIVNADSAVVGKDGKIVFKATRDINAAADSVTSASGKDGGSVTMQAGGTTLVEGKVDATGDQGKGGTVHLLGYNVGLAGNASVDASGVTGGGTVLVGGDYRGQGSVPNAWVTYTGENTRIAADGRANGDGGKVIVWADHTTRSYAGISARGGMVGGNGGFVETSGKHFLDVGNSFPDVSALSGKPGIWLLDPDDIKIFTTAGTQAVANGGMFTPGSGTSLLSASLIVNYLQSSGNVIVDTSSGGTGVGNIIIDEAITPTLTVPRSLTFKAHNNITSSANISATGNALNVNMIADQDASGSGGVSLSGSVDTNGGSFSASGNSIDLNGVDTLGGSVTLSASTGSIDFQTVNTGGGAFNATALNGTITVRGPLDAGTGNIRLEGDAVSIEETVATNGGTFDATAHGGSVSVESWIRTSGGNIRLKGNGIDFYDDVDASVAGGGGDLSLISASSIHAYSGSLIGRALSISAAGEIDDGDGGNVSVLVSSLKAANSGSAAVTNFHHSGTSSLSVVDISSVGDIYVGSSGNIQISGDINAGSSDVSLSSADKIIGNGGIVKGTQATFNAANGIGAASSVNTKVSKLVANNSSGAGDIRISNTGPLHILNIMNVDGQGNGTGGIYVDNIGALTVDPNGASPAVKTASGTIALIAHSPLNVNGGVTSTSGTIVLTAGASGVPGRGDILTLTAPVTTGGSIFLNAGDTIVGASNASGGSVTPAENLNIPTLSVCVARPTAPGCDHVLPTLDSCASNPQQTGCNVVLPTVNSCVSNPQQTGCNVVLPTLESCALNRNQPGCEAVLPTLATCLASPQQLGCNQVLPSIESCALNRNQTGCDVVLPTLAMCLASPQQLGCNQVLPSIESCALNRNQTGCDVVLPTLAMCLANPQQLGCNQVLPSIESCVLNRNQTGCNVVLPTLAMCLANPLQTGCNVVLPTFDSCLANPLQSGCELRLPTLVSCIANSQQAGCKVVLPTQSNCLANPRLAGCEIYPRPTTTDTTNVNVDDTSKVVIVTTRSTNDGVTTKLPINIVKTVSTSPGNTSNRTSSTLLAQIFDDMTIGGSDNNFGGEVKPVEKTEDKKAGTDDQSKKETKKLAVCK